MNEDTNYEKNDGVFGKAVWTKDGNGLDSLGDLGWEETSLSLHKQIVDTYNEGMGIKRLLYRRQDKLKKECLQVLAGRS